MTIMCIVSLLLYSWSSSRSLCSSRNQAVMSFILVKYADLVYGQDIFFKYSWKLTISQMMMLRLMTMMTMKTVKRHYIKTTGLIDQINSFFDRILRLLHLHPSHRTVTSSIVVCYHGTLYVYNLSSLSLKSGYFRLQICSVARIYVL